MLNMCKMVHSKSPTSRMISLKFRCRVLDENVSSEICFDSIVQFHKNVVTIECDSTELPCSSFCYLPNDKTKVVHTIGYGVIQFVLFYGSSFSLVGQRKPVHFVPRHRYISYIMKLLDCIFDQARLKIVKEWNISGNLLAWMIGAKAFNQLVEAQTVLNKPILHFWIIEHFDKTFRKTTILDSECRLSNAQLCIFGHTAILISGILKRYMNECIKQMQLELGLFEIIDIDMLIERYRMEQIHTRKHIYELYHIAPPPKPPRKSLKLASQNQIQEVKHKEETSCVEDVEQEKDGWNQLNISRLWERTQNSIRCSCSQLDKVWEKTKNTVQYYRE